MKKNGQTINNIAKAGVCAALYVVLTLIVSPIAYGPFQMRISEIFNHMLGFNKRYIWALTLGCFIVNIQSPLGPIDAVVGPIGTIVMGLLIWQIDKRVKTLNAKLVVSTVIPTVLGMIPVAMELHFIQHVPFWLTYGTCMIGELVSLIIGAFLIKKVSKRIDLTR